MWTKSVNRRFARFVLLAGLAFAVTNAWGLDSAKSAGTSEATKAGGAGQGGRETTGQPNAPNAKRVAEDYIIGPSDVLAINVWKDTELTRTVTVRPDGKISLPLIGELAVNGLTAPSVQRLIAQRLAEYVSKPLVTVIVQEVKSKTYVVVGKVAKPGAYELGKPTTVLEAIAIAGGFLDFAKVSKVNIIRRRDGGPSETLHFDYKKVIKGQNAEQNVELKSGDTIVVP
jgi:polysaccharide export outer membrane protein